MAKKNPTPISVEWVFFIDNFELSIIFNIFNNMGTEPKMITDTNKIPTFLTIDANKKYYNFESFYEDNKDTIYKGIVSLYEQLSKRKDGSLKIVVKSSIENTPDANLIFDKSDTNVLMKFILPYYENNENYEMCGHIMKIYKKL